MSLEIQFGDCNLVLVDSAHLGFEAVLGTPLTQYTGPSVGDLTSFPTSHPNATITTLPMPLGRMRNHLFQKEILGCADAFILVLDTCGFFGGNRWIQQLAEYQVPVVCWIERVREEQCILDYKNQTRNSLLKQYRDQEKLVVSKENETTTVKKDSRRLNNYARSWPVKDYNLLVNEIKTTLGEETVIFSFDSTGLSRRYGGEPKEKKDLGPVKELFERTVQECLRVQKERGVNQKVLENKKKNTKIRAAIGWDLGDEVVEEKPKAKKTEGGLFSGLSKFFNFGSSSKTLKT